jgi:hypothetical protein
MDAKKTQKQMSTAEEIIKLAGKIAARANGAANLASGKLSPLYISSPPRPETNLKDTKAYPPLFSDLRAILLDTDNALERIMDTLNKVEL